MEEIRILLSNKDFVLLAIGFGLGLAYFNSLVTVLGQQIQILGYTDNDAGLYGFLLLGFGMVGCAVFGPLMDATHKYKAILKSLAVLSIVAVAALCVSLRPNNHVMLGIVFALLGFLVLPLLPTSFECMVECTYPMPEEVTNGIMLSIGNVVGVGMTILWQRLIDDTGHYQGIFVSYNYVQVSFLGLAIVFLFLFDGDYKRLTAERVHADAVSATRCLTSERFLEPESGEAKAFVKRLLNREDTGASLESV